MSATTTLGAMIATAALAMGSTAAMAAGHTEGTTVQADVLGAKGTKIGTVTLEQTPNGVLIAADMNGLPEGEHGFHLHTTGKCEAGEGFASAGGHYAPRQNQHGLREAAGAHAGDMPNQFVGKDGRLRAHVLNPAVTLAAGFNSLRDADGTALMVHAGADDYTSQPSGDAGSRLACAVIAAPME